MAQWLGRRGSDQGVPGSNPDRCTFRCDIEQVTYLASYRLNPGSGGRTTDLDRL